MKGYLVMLGFLGAILTIVYFNTRTEEVPEDIHLTLVTRRNVAIDFMAQYPSWRYTLCNTPLGVKEDFTDSGVGCTDDCLQ